MARKPKAAAVDEAFRELAFKARPNLSTMYLGLGVAQVILGAVGLLAGTAAAAFLLAGPLLVWISRWFATTDLVRLRRDTMVVSLAPMRAPQTFGYGEIEEIVRVSPAAAHLRLRGRDVKLPLAALPAGDVERVLTEIQSGRERGWAASSSIGG